MSAVRPLTLSVVPVNGVTTNIPIPNFNHVPVSPIIVNRTNLKTING